MTVPTGPRPVPVVLGVIDLGDPVGDVWTGLLDRDVAFKTAGT